MKTLYTSLIILFLAITPLFAQDQPSADEHQPPSADQIVAMMQAKLNLSEDQVSAITPIIEKYSSKREELHQNMEDGTVNRDSVKTQMKQLREDEGQELSQILSADQMNQFKKLMERRRHPPEGEGQDGSAQGPGAQKPEGGNNGGE